MDEVERRELADRMAKEIGLWAESAPVIGAPSERGDVVMGGMTVGTFGSTFSITSPSITPETAAMLRRVQDVPLAEQTRLIREANGGELKAMPSAPTDVDGLEAVERGRRIERAWQAASDAGWPEDRYAGLTYDEGLRRDASPTGDPGEHGPYAGATQAKHLPVAVVLHLIAAMEDVGCGAQRLSIVAALGAPENVVVAKLDKLLRRKWIDGCLCGCRGDFSVLAR